MGKIKYIYLKIKQLFYWNKTMNFEFSNINVADIEKKINLKHKAETDGRNNIPPTNSVVRSITEEEAITEYDNIRHNDVDKAVNFLEPIKNKIIGYKSKLFEKHFFLDSFRERVNQTKNTARGKLSTLLDTYKTQNAELNHFKLSNDLTRDPQSLTPTRIFIGILIVLGLFIFEAEVNKKLLAPALAGGEGEALGVVYSVAGLNVIISFIAGYFLLKNIHIKNGLKKIISKIILTIYSVFIIYLNWCLGAFRADAEQKGQVVAWGQTDQSAIQAIDNNVLLPWTVDFSFYAFVLTFVGISFALISLLDGYFFDDPYPGYGAIGKGRNENKNEINRIRENLPNEVGLLFKKETQNVKEKRDQLITNDLKNWSMNITKLESVFASYSKFVQKISDDTEHIIKEYISINSMFRTDPAPKYWMIDDNKVKDHHYEMEIEKSDPKKVFPDLAQLYLDNNEISQENKKLNQYIVEESNKYQSELNNYQIEVNKEVEKIRDEFKVE